jgi:sarcosine oxidase
MAELPITGGCNCGAVRFEVTEPLVLAVYCHCRRCQRRTGTAASVNAVPAPGSFRLTQGSESVHGWTPPGGGATKYFCAQCGSHLFSDNPAHPDPMSIRMGAFDDDPGVRPSLRQYVAYAAPWEAIPDDGLPRFPEGRHGGQAAHLPQAEAAAAAAEPELAPEPVASGMPAGGSTTADVIVVGLGAMGVATAMHLARGGASVIGIDRYAPPHALGSTHGDTRVTRVACAEGADYVPLARRSHELWRELERETGAAVFEQCGVLMVGPGMGLGSMHGAEDWVATTIDLARRFDVEHEALSGAEARRRFPMFGFDPASSAYFEPGGGFVRPEAAVAAQLEVAARSGAQLHTDEVVTDIRSADGRVEVETDAGTYTAGHVVLCVGSWLRDFLAGADVASQFIVYRQVQHWFDVDPAWQGRVTTDDGCPVWLWSFGEGPTDFFYGFPAIDGPEGGIKVASEQFAIATTADAVPREVPDDEAQAMYDRCLRDRLLAVTSKRLRSATCLYTVTPDSGFIVDRHPKLADVTIVSACSGHGFKHSAAIGEAVAQRVTTGASQLDLSGFALSRLR